MMPDLFLVKLVSTGKSLGVSNIIKSVKLGFRNVHLLF